jgi:hypothetical protein
MKKSKNKDSVKSEFYNFKCRDETQFKITRENERTYFTLNNLIFSQPEGLEGLSMAIQSVIAGSSGLPQDKGSINFAGAKCDIEILSAEPKMTKSKMPLGFIHLIDKIEVKISLIYEKTKFDSLVNNIETLGKNYIKNLIFKIKLNPKEIIKSQSPDSNQWICYDYQINNLIK